MIAMLSFVYPTTYKKHAKTYDIFCQLVYDAQHTIN